MNPEIKSLWVGALRSGEYAQSGGQLRRSWQDEPTLPAEYCCLGVLCDLYAKATGVEWEWDDETDMFMGKISYQPKVVSEWAGMSDDEAIGEFKNADEFFDVVSMNDTGNSFAEIADIIERLG